MFSCCPLKSTWVHVFLFFIFPVFQLSHGVEVEGKDQDKLCLYANLMVNFSVSYDIAGNKVSD